jgi:flagellin-specific chaperone FliS
MEFSEYYDLLVKLVQSQEEDSVKFDEVIDALQRLRSHPPTRTNEGKDVIIPLGLYELLLNSLFHFELDRNTVRLNNTELLDALRDAIEKTK